MTKGMNVAEKMCYEFYLSHGVPSNVYYGTKAPDLFEPYENKVPKEEKEELVNINNVKKEGNEEMEKKYN